MEIVIAAAFGLWLTFFAVWAFLKVRADYKDVDTKESSRKKEERR